MYKVPKKFDKLVRELSSRFACSTSDARQFIYIELTLYLAEQLKLDAEPLNIGWVLLSRMPLNHPLLNNLSAQQRRMLANAAQIVPLSSRYAWEAALLRYKNISLGHRLYEYSAEVPFDKQMIDLCRQEPSAGCPLRCCRARPAHGDPLSGDLDQR